MLGIGAWELTIIFAIVLVLFGSKRLPGLATSLGQAINNFRIALRGSSDDEKLLSEKNPDNKNGPLAHS